MKKHIARAVVLVLFFVGSVVFLTAASAEAKGHVAGKVCASKWVYTHLKSKTAKKCKRQGFFYDIGTYPVSTETTPWTMASYVLVYGPKGRLWVDTAGFYAQPNVR